MDFTTEIESFFTDIQDMLQVIAPVAAMIGILTVAILHFGASVPVVRQFKERNPDMVANLVTGFFLLFIASSLVSLISFS